MRDKPKTAHCRKNGIIKVVLKLSKIMEIKFLSGWKTYIAAGILIVYSIYAQSVGLIPQEKAIELVLLALNIIGLRSGIESLKASTKK